MSGSVEDLGAPESWEVADLEESVTRLMLKDSKKETKLRELDVSSALASSASKVSDDVINQVDQFLRDALQNPRERLSNLYWCAKELMWRLQGCSHVKRMFHMSCTLWQDL